MSSKHATYISLLAIITLGIIYFIGANSFTQGAKSATLGPGYFPNILAVLLFILSGISFIQTFKKNEKDDKIISFHNFKVVIATIITTIFFFLAWNYLGYFYVNLFLFTCVLLTIFNLKFEIKKITFDALISLFVSVIIYLLFQKIIGIPL